MSGPASVFEGDDFVVKFLPLSSEDVGTRDDDVNFLRARSDGAANFRNAILKGRKPRGETRGDGRDIYIGTFEGAAGGFDKEVIDTNGANVNMQIGDAKFLNNFVLNWLPRF